MARPANDSPADNRTIVQTYRCTEMERDQIKAKAALTGYSVSEFQRRACRDAVVVVRDNAIDREAVRQLLAIGNNLNQLTKDAHSGVYRRDDLQAKLSKLDTLLTRLLDDTARQLLIIGEHLRSLLKAVEEDVDETYDHNRLDAVLSKLDTLLTGLLDGTEG